MGIDYIENKDVLNNWVILLDDKLSFWNNDDMKRWRMKIFGNFIHTADDYPSLFGLHSFGTS